MSRISRPVLTVSLLTFIMISAVTYGIYTQMTEERVCDLKQSVIDTVFVTVNIAEYRRNVAVDLINTLNPAEEQLLVGLRIAYADLVSPSYLYDAGSYLIPSDEYIQVKEFERNYYTDIMRVIKHRHVKSTGFISFDDKTFIYYPYPVIHNRGLIFLLGPEYSFLLSRSLATDNENLMFSLLKNSKPVTGDEYNAENAILTVPETMRYFSYLLTRLYVFAYKKDVYFQVCMLIIFFAVLVAVISDASCPYLVCRVINRDTAEKEAIINNHSERVLDGGLFLSAADVRKLYSMYNSAFLDDLTKTTGRKSSDEGLKALPEKGGYLCLFDVDRLKSISDTFGRLLGDEVLMKVMKTLRSQVPTDKGKVYRFRGDEFAVIYTGGTLEELLPILKEAVHFQVGNTNLSISTDVAHSNECTIAERLKMLTDKRLCKSKKSGKAQISQQ